MPEKLNIMSVFTLKNLQVTKDNRRLHFTTLDDEVGFGPQPALRFYSPAQGEYRDSTSITSQPITFKIYSSPIIRR